MKILDDYISDMMKNNEKVLDGKACFKLSDTYGFPIDLTKEILEEKGLTADEEGYTKEMDEQREKARAARGGSKYMGADETVFHKIDRDFHTEFVGHLNVTVKYHLLQRKMSLLKTQAAEMRSIILYLTKLLSMQKAADR